MPIMYNVAISSSLVLVENREVLNEGKVGGDGVKLFSADRTTVVTVVSSKHSL